jgi:DNA-binding NarL/FixJ family response regulator
VGKSASNERLGTDAGRRLRVLVVDDDPLVRRTVRAALRAEGILVVGEVDNGRDALRAARYYRPDIILLDVVLPGIDGISALEQIVADGETDAKVIVLSVRGERDLGYLALRKGAAGYINKDLDLEALPAILRDVAAGGAAVSCTLAADLVRRLREWPEAPIGMRPVKSELTTREWEIVDQLCLGRSIRDVADALVLSTETVRSHVKNIMRKLEVHSLAETIEVVERLRAGEARPRIDNEYVEAPIPAA